MLNSQLTPWYTSVGSRENAFLGFYEVLNEEAPVPRIETKTPHRGKAGRKVERNNSGLNDAKCRCAPRPSGLHRMREFPDTLLDTTDSWPRDAANRISAKRSSFRFERHRSVNERSLAHDRGEQKANWCGKLQSQRVKLPGARPFRFLRAL